MLRINANAAGASCAAVIGVVYVICAAAYAIIPDATLAFFGTLFHGLDIRKVAVPMTWGGIVGGLLIAVVGAYLLTLLWATWYNRMLGANSGAGGTHSCCKQ